MENDVTSQYLSRRPGLQNLGLVLLDVRYSDSGWKWKTLILKVPRIHFVASTNFEKLPFLLKKWVKCISTSFWVLRTPESWLNYFLQRFSTFFVHFKTFSVIYSGQTIDVYINYDVKCCDIIMTYVEWGGIFGIYSSGTKTRKKQENDPMETTVLNRKL